MIEDFEKFIDKNLGSFIEKYGMLTDSKTKVNYID